MRESSKQAQSEENTIKTFYDTNLEIASIKIIRKYSQPTCMHKKECGDFVQISDDRIKDFLLVLRNI
jgi:hypothetical protein